VSKYNKFAASLVFVLLSYISLLLMLLLPCATGVLQGRTHRLDDQLHHLMTNLCDPTLQHQNLKQADGLLSISAKFPNALLVNTSLSAAPTSTDRPRDQS
jgi:hypothetical protein